MLFFVKMILSIDINYSVYNGVIILFRLNIYS